MRRTALATLLAAALALQAEPQQEPRCRERGAALDCRPPAPALDCRAPGAGPALCVEGAARALWVAWRTDAELAYAALLLRALEKLPRCANGGCHLALCHEPQGVCHLLTAPKPGLDDAIVVGFETLSELGACNSTPRLYGAVGGAVHGAGGAGGACDPTVLVAERVPLLQHAPWLLRALRQFAPGAAAVRDLLALEPAARCAADQPGEAALRVARPELPEALANYTERYRLLVYHCHGEDWGGDQTYDDLISQKLGPWLLKQTSRRLVEVQLESKAVSCGRETRLRDELQRQLVLGGAHRLLGAVAAGAGVGEAARLARRERLALVSYDAQTDANGADALEVGPRAEELGAALSSLLAACRWRRAAVLSVASAAARAVREAMHAADAAGPLRHVLVSDAAQLNATLRSLRAQDVRVFVLNADGAMAAFVLQAAAAQGLDARRGCTWLVREWASPRAPPRALLPLLALRAGPRGAAGGAGAPAALLARVWGGTWPARAAPLVDAVMTLTLGFTRLFEEHEGLRYDHRVYDIFELLRDSLKRQSLPGVARTLTFDARGARPPPLEVELWSEAGAAPAVSALPPAACPLPAPPGDALQACSLPVGGAFAPSACLDLAAALGAPALLLAALLAGYAAAALRRRRARRACARLSRLRAQAAIALVQRQRDTASALTPLLVERERVTLLHALGAGRHGRVWLARLAPAGVALAAKTPHAGCSPAEEGELLREAATLAPLRHAHVLRLLGVCVGPGPPLLLTPVARHGDLLRYLRARRPPGGEASEAAHVSAPALTRLGREAALALAYLASQGVVHCDVRAANCLLDERRELKLADFGMARALSAGSAGAAGAGGAEGGEYYACRRRALFPVLWMAPESLARGAFSCASDVWALGVLVVELVSLGARPFGSLGAAEAVALVARGGHARLPAGAGAEARALARACWRREARARPSAAEVAAWLAARPHALLPAPQPDAEDAELALSDSD